MSGRYVWNDSQPKLLTDAVGLTIQKGQKVTSDTALLTSASIAEHVCIMVHSSLKYFLRKTSEFINLTKASNLMITIDYKVTNLSTVLNLPKSTRRRWMFIIFAFMHHLVTIKT